MGKQTKFHVPAGRSQELLGKIAGVVGSIYWIVGSESRCNIVVDFTVVAAMPAGMSMRGVWLPVRGGVFNNVVTAPILSVMLAQPLIVSRDSLPIQQLRFDLPV